MHEGKDFLGSVSMLVPDPIYTARWIQRAGFNACVCFIELQSAAASGRMQKSLARGKAVRSVVVSLG